jgi:hypothetical protein
LSQKPAQSAQFDGEAGLAVLLVSDGGQNRMPEPTIRVIPTPLKDVLALLQSPALQTVERAIAAQVGSKIVEDFSTTYTSYIQSDMSVSGLTVAETETLLQSHRDEISAFGVAFLRDEEATREDEEFPSGEGGEHPLDVEVQGLGVGFGVTYAIYYNFLANRTPAEFKAYLKNRRIPHRAKFARELRRVFDSARDQRADA